MAKGMRDTIKCSHKSVQKKSSQFECNSWTEEDGRLRLLNDRVANNSVIRAQPCRGLRL